jgi:ABC-type multidrug transport system fused ATPase/permease subunit
MSLPLKQYWDLLYDYLKPQQRRVAVLTALLLLSTALPLLGPQILRAFIDDATAGASMHRLLALAVTFIAVALATQAIAVLIAWVGETVGWHATNLLRGDLALHCLTLDMPFHNTHAPGELIERIDGDVTALAILFSRLVIGIVGSLLLLLGVLILLFHEDVRVGMAMLGFVAVLLLALARFREVAVPHVLAERQASAELFGFVEERLAGVEDIRANGGGAYVMRRYVEVMRALFFRKRRASVMSSGLFVLTAGLFAVGTALMLGMGAWLYRAGAVTIGTVFLFFQYTQALRRPIEMVADQLREFQRAGAGAGRIHELLQVRRTIHDGHGAPLADGPLALAFDGVSFGYGDDEAVLTDISFTLAPGRVLGLLGRTGSGKTTLTRLLFRLWEPTSGSIRLGGVDLRDLRLAELRRRVGIVTQDVQLFQASVRDNLSFFDPQVTDEQIARVLALLGLDGWLRTLPDGLETPLGPAGTGLSAGESQLLAFARVFLQDPGLVVLDEASSRLDPASERLIERAVDRLIEGRTTIVIAHRLSTVQRADEILVLDHGRVHEHGERMVLAADPRSRFAALLRTGLHEVEVPA